MFFKTRQSVTDLEKLNAILEYLKQEMDRWQLCVRPVSPVPADRERSQAYADKVNARIMYLEEQIALTSARIAVENINPNQK